MSTVISCGALPTPGNGRKSTFFFTPGTMVKFDCDPGYVLTGNYHFLDTYNRSISEG